MVKAEVIPEWTQADFEMFKKLSWFLFRGHPREITPEFERLPEYKRFDELYFKWLAFNKYMETKSKNK